MHIGWYIDEPSPGRAPSPGRRSLGFSARRSTPSDAWKAYTDRGIRTPASTSPDSVQPATIEPLHQPQEDTLPRIPGQQAIHQTAAAADDLAGNLDHCRTERLELHPQQRSLLDPVLPGVPGRLGHQQRGPRLQLQARLAMTMYAQLLTRLSTGVVRACTPPLSWATRFSWSHRPPAVSTA